jgi:hypothetical protein
MKFGQRLFPVRSRPAVRGAKIPTGLPSTPDTIDCAVGVTDAGSKKVCFCLDASIERPTPRAAIKMLQLHFPDAIIPQS